MKNATVLTAIVNECNEAILLFKRRPTIARQMSAEEVLTTCANVARACLLHELEILIRLAMEQLEQGEPECIQCSTQSAPLQGVA